jgi:DNA-binding IclR family transcriptional regulator
VSVLAKAAHVIDVLNRNVSPTKLGAIAEEVGLPKSSTHRLLNEMVALGMVRKLEDGIYTPGYRLVQWGHAADLALGIRQVAEPIMRRLSDEVRESVHLHVREGSHRVCVAGVPGPQTLRPEIQLGQTLPLGIGASGKILLAYADDRVRSLMRDRGWAMSESEMERGLTAVSAAVPTRDGSALGALTVAGATARLSEERCADVRPRVVAAAHELAHTLGA